MAWNLVKTALAGKAVDGETMVVPRVVETVEVPWKSLIFGRPIIVMAAVLGLTIWVGFLDTIGALGMIAVITVIGVGGGLWLQLTRPKDRPTWHRLLEGRPLLFTALSIIAVLIGGAAEIIPSLVINRVEARTAATRPYKPLELEGRDVYLREGCYLCHSQMIRTFRFETLRYGDRSQLVDSIWDHPFQWGSKRTGPDLARIGGKYPNLWHFEHLQDPRSTSPGSNMPPYAFLADKTVNFGRTSAKVEAMQKLGVPYTDEEVDSAETDAEKQAGLITADLKAAGVEVAANSELVAVVAYLQSLGKLGPPPNDSLPPGGAVSQVIGGQK
jgi:cytochrome c oxidase cbb3-type subunit I/II